MSPRSSCPKHGRNEYTCGLCRDEEVNSLKAQRDAADRRACYYSDLNRDQCSDLIAKDYDIATLTKRCEALTGAVEQVDGLAREAEAPYTRESRCKEIALTILRITRAALESNVGRGRG